MIKVVVFLALFVSFLFSDSTLLVKKGWQLIGLSSSVENLSIFESENVEQVWHYDAKSQKWKGYSPDASVQKRITDKDFNTIAALKSWHGFWVKSKRDWQLVSNSDDKTPIKEDNNITLEKGWNLISLPIDTVVSPRIFDDVTIWKYANDKKWEFFDLNKSNMNFPTISHISNSDGIWVKSKNKQIISVPENSAKLLSFKSEVEVKEYIRDMLFTNDRPYFGYYSLERNSDDASFQMEVGGAQEATADASSKVADATGTNLQESDVDESDILKHDGVNIFFVDKPYSSKVSVTTFARILEGEEKPLKFIELNSSKMINSLYLSEGKLVILSSLNNNVYTEDIAVKTSKPAPYQYLPPKISIDTYNVSNINDIDLIGSFVIDGNIKDSRVVDGKLVLISSFYPNIEKEYPKIYVDVPECRGGGGGVTQEYVKPTRASDFRCYDIYSDNDGKFYKYDYDNPIIKSENLIPQIKKNDEVETSLLRPATFYVPIKKNQVANITTVSKINIEDMNLLDTSSVLGHYGVVYASSKALYLVSNEYPMYYDFNSYKERSSIYKFQIDVDLAYKGMGFVNGRALNQFSLSEYDNVLRIATTEGYSWSGDTTNSIYTLTEDDGLLKQLGFLGGLGLEGEIIYSVRFMGEKGFVVTFRQTDPFYTLDLSDPKNPRKVGELKIEGYSSYLHPVGSDMIMGIGRDENRKLKLELFDISDFSNPDSVDKYIFDGTGNYYSEAERNHKALAFRASDNLFAMPFSGGNYNIGYGNYLGVFQIVDKKFKAYNALIDSSANYYGGLSRGIIFDLDGVTYVAYLTNGKATFATLDSLEKE